MAELQPPATAQLPPKSPPLAFQSSSNDALWAPVHYSPNVPSLTSPTISQLADLQVSESEMEMQAQLDKQSEALRLQNQAFVAERESWQFERDRLYRRIASLESLLKGTASGHSPARSPVISPHSGGTMYSPPHARGPTPLGISRLASIAEVYSTKPPLVENRRPSPLLKRDFAPKSIDLSSIIAAAAPSSSFDGATTTEEPHSEPKTSENEDMVDEVPRSPPQSRGRVSPPPLKNRHLAGHTPLRGSITGPLSPALSCLSERLDTPTRSNTTLNQTTSHDTDEDRPLKGPLMMPELPNQPGEENFTMDMLAAKLRDLAEHPEESEPMVLKAPTPAQEVPPKEDDTSEKVTVENITSQSESSNSNATTEDVNASQPGSSESKLTSPSAATQTADTFDAGIKLRKKLSCNFGAPLGQLNPNWKH